LICVIGRAQEEETYFQHTVKAGQTLYSIANMYEVTVSQITKANPTTDTMIFTGQILRIPQQKKKSYTFKFHTIKARETLFHVAQTYKVTVKEICDVNPGLNAANFKSGEVIRIPLESTGEKSNQTTTDGVKVTVPTANTVQPSHQNTVTKYKEMHKVKRKETVYSICKKYGISETDLVTANPNIRSVGLQKGDLIYIPYPTPTASAPKVPNDKELFEQNKAKRKAISTIKMAIMLPFAEDKRMVEYYEGLLLAADSMKQSGVSMDIYAYDTSKENVSNLLSTKSAELANMDVIFGPRETTDIKKMGDFAKEHEIRLVIPFTSKNNEVFTNPFIYMVNTPQLYLYNTVYEHFLRQFTNANVIFIENTVNDKSKEQFIKGFKDNLLRNGVTYTSVTDASTVDNMADQLFTNRTNVFIPTSGTHVELIKILTKMELLKRNNRSMKLCLFGYPEWQTMTKEHLKQLFAIDTYFYSAFFTNNIMQSSRNFEKLFKSTYHKMMEERYPKYGILGYDTGLYFLKGLSTFGNQFDDEADNVKTKSIQTGFYMKRVNNWGGFINQKIFFIHYNTNSIVEKIEFE
jgi:LysM repeat protein